ncbi:MAG: tRNA (5-methylaminomethyl-2-thiouridylate)-methyltransferase [Acidiferrobacterales bacterium]
MTQVRKAVALISGGLDSLLAARLILDQGIHVEGINFYTGFCVEGHTHAIRQRRRDKPLRNNALWVAEQLGIRLHLIEVVEEYKEVVINPKHGYGANLNPCLDCKGFMVGKARAWMEAHGFDFIITGEVIGQRPNSQRRDALPVVARESGAFDRLLRPLCARLLAPTLPELEGWVDRDRLLALNGRNRKPQIALAESYGFRDYAQPAGGCCFLTDANYSNRLSDLWTTRGNKHYELDDIMLLKVGRHMRPHPNFKLIIGREEGENNYLGGYRRRFVHMAATSHHGPLVLIEGEPTEADVELAARLTARFGQGRNADKVTVEVIDLEGGSRLLEVSPFPSEEIPSSWYL